MEKDLRGITNERKERRPKQSMNKNENKNVLPSKEDWVGPKLYLAIPWTTKCYRVRGPYSLQLE